MPPSSSTLTPSPRHLTTILYRPQGLGTSRTPLPCLAGAAPGTQVTVLIQAKFLDYASYPFAPRRLWGSDIYTDDSDPLLAAVHAGIYKPSWPHPCDRPIGYSSYPPIDHDLQLTLVVHPCPPSFPGQVRNFVGSRDWVGIPHHGGAFRVLSAKPVPLGTAVYGGGLRGRKARMRLIHGVARAEASLGPTQYRIYTDAQDIPS
ncbi:MAG: hypothetical protein DHS80DRAFT_23037 [Piptocephalis tieghemiana]|nr:MAG: hypothetical protein DHS80DRAFT_23037 [Piptocephalis tieghemiana]